jgi:hypothetical protein
LTNGTAYTFKATATNATGTSDPSAASLPVEPVGPPVKPDPPRITLALPSDESAIITVAKGPGSGGTPVSYTVTSTPGSFTCTITVPDTSCVVPGLSNGTAYTFTATATNAGGESGPSTVSTEVIPRDPPPAPNPPTITDVVPGDGEATITVAEGEGPGGAPESYEVTASPGGATCTITPPATSCVVRGLTNGTVYTFTVTAENEGGTSEESRISSEVTPIAPPTAPRDVSATAGDGEATITWTAPMDNGGSEITSYTVTAEPGGRTCTWVSGALGCTVAGLANGTAYTFTVTATNAAGTSPPSSVSPVVTPSAPVPVVPAPTMKAGKPASLKGAVRIPVAVTGPGTVIVVGARKGGPQVVCRGTVRFTKAGRKTLMCLPTAAGQRLRAKGPVTFRLTLSFTPKGGKVVRSTIGSARFSRTNLARQPVTG